MRYSLVILLLYYSPAATLESRPDRATQAAIPQSPPESPRKVGGRFKHLPERAIHCCGSFDGRQYPKRKGH
jgi:hypothetical protein